MREVVGSSPILTTINKTPKAFASGVFLYYLRRGCYVINEYAVKHDVKELIRIAAILRENEKRGSDVIESLARESRYLWDERKIIARESGKAIDTKMSYPLGLLLIVLIVITIAPALLNM